MHWKQRCLCFLFLAANLSCLCHPVRFVHQHLPCDVLWTNRNLKPKEKMHSSWGVGSGFARLNVFYPPMDKEVKLDTCWYRLIDRKKEMEVKKKRGERWLWMRTYLTCLNNTIIVNLISFVNIIQMRSPRGLSIIQLWPNRTNWLNFYLS